MPDGWFDGEGDIGEEIGNMTNGGNPETLAMRDFRRTLLRATDWVVAEFAYLTDLMHALGCSSNDVVDGRSFKLDGRLVIHVDPKRSYIGVNLPEELRGEAEALNQVVATRPGRPWVRYDADLCDRDTIEALVNRALVVIADTASAGQSVPRDLRSGSRAIEPRRISQSNGPDDHQDLILILAVVQAAKAHQVATGAPSGIKVLREAIFFFWEARRLPSGGKYSPFLPHSPAARQQRVSARRGDLVYEHVIPISVVIRRLLNDVPADVAALRAILETTSERVIITKAEDRQLSAAGQRQVDPGNDIWSRYRTIGLGPSDFQPLSTT